nr:immunoglobulin heavy chain junction region [Macaca mulatta]MOX62945.1 immunoglobulin heavy chain junction region [Macaca mulatta]MOX67841.1 immunoglobulin heavy chain junction region [Macaca mulatta]MOX68149.1 immunoglobulin heavy chain junction region [Macaca mulatta]
CAKWELEQPSDDW